MADNIMGGYGSSDITANIEVNLNNIDRSTQDAATLASQLKDWGSSIEAANKQLQDYNTTQSEMLQTASDLAEAHESIVKAARELREISAASNVNLRDMAQNAREIQSALSGLGGASGAPYIPGMSSASPASVVDSSLSPGMGMPGAPEATPSDFGMSSGGGTDLITSLANASLLGGGGRGGGGSGTSASVKDGIYEAGSAEDSSYGQSMAKKMLGINYWMPGGKAAALGRYIDRLSNGGVTSSLGGYVSKYKGIFGTPTQDLNSTGEAAFSDYMKKQGFINAAGKGISAEAANSMLGDASSGMTLDAIQGGAVAAAEAGGLGVIAEGGLLGSLGGLMAAAAPIAAVGYLGMQGYNAYANFQKQGQLLGSLTGENNSGKMVGMEATDFLGTLFNPRMGYGAAKEIQMTGLSAGYQGDVNGVFNNASGGAGLLGQYTSFASNAYQQYGISPQESLSMFQAGIIQAGASVTDLSGALRNLANTSQTTNTSFAVLQEQFTSFLSGIASVGGTGNAAIQLATANALTNQNNPLLSGAGSTASMLQGQVGQALAAQQMGVSYTQMFNITGTPQGLQAASQASNQVFLNILRNMGLSPGMPNLKNAVGSMAYALPTILTQLGITNPKGGAWTEQTAVDYTMNALSLNGQGENASVGSGNEVKNLFAKLTGGKAGSEGLKNMLADIDRTEIGHQGGSTALDAIAAKNNTTYETEYKLTPELQKRLGLSSQYISGSGIMGLSAANQKLVAASIDQGKTTIGERFSDGTTMGFNNKNSLANLYNNKTLAGINNGSLTQVELGPKAAKLFELINNPSQLSNFNTQDRARSGNGSNTTQTPMHIQ